MSSIGRCASRGPLPLYDALMQSVLVAHRQDCTMFYGLLMLDVYIVSECVQERVTNYLALPNPINMCQMHLGRLLRVYTRIEARTDMYHICKCLFGTSIR